jgi:hypothetical protein
VDVSGLLIAVLLVTPLIVGLFSLISNNTRQALFLFGSLWLINSAFMVMCLIFVTLPVEIHISELFSFIISRNALLINLSVHIACGFMMITRIRKADGSLSKALIAFSALTISLSGMAFLAANFLLRYIALELLGLVLAVVILFSNGFRDKFRLASKIFIILKLGDLGMLVGILIMSGFTGTLDIQAAIEGSKGLPSHMIAWVLSGFILAGLVKMGVWPFYFWIKGSKETVPTSLHWMFDVMVPSLGMYLLYRITPLVSLSLVINSVVFYSATLFLLILAVILSLKPRKYAPVMIMNIALGASMVLLSATGSSDAVLKFLLINILIRMMVQIAAPVKKYHLVMHASISLLIGSLLLIMTWQLYVRLAIHEFVIVLAAMTLIIILLMQRIFRSGEYKEAESITRKTNVKFTISAISSWIFLYIERGIFHDGVEIFTRSVIKMVSRIYWIFEIRLVELVTSFFHRFILGFQKVNEAAEEGVKQIFVQKGQAFVRFVSTFFETYGIDKGAKLLGDSIVKGGEGVKRIEERSFRKNLLWIPLMLLFIILFLILMPLLSASKS